MATRDDIKVKVGQLTDEELCRQIAWIAGPASAAAQALDLLVCRRREGRAVTIKKIGRYWVVESD